MLNTAQLEGAVPYLLCQNISNMPLKDEEIMQGAFHMCISI